jgi:CRP-like cAMP-binding protein
MKFREIPLFSNLTNDELKVISSICIGVRYEDDNEVIFNEGDIGDALYIIHNGLVDIKKVIDKAEGTEKVLATLPPGAFFGEMSLLSNEVRSASAKTKGKDVELIVIRQNDFMELMTKNAKIASSLLFSIIKIISDRVRITNLELVTLYDTGKIIGATKSFDELIHKILERIMKSVNTNYGMMILYNEFTDFYEVKTSVGFDDINLFGVYFEKSSYFLKQLIEKKEYIIIENTDLIEDENFEFDKNIGYIKKSMLLVPLIYNDEVTGVMVVANDNEKFFNLTHANLLTGVANQVAQAVINAKLQQENESRDNYNRVFITANL